MKISFKIELSNSNTLAGFRIGYSTSDLAFVTIPARKDADFSVLVNDIELGVVDSCVSIVSGFCPYQGWKEFNQVFPKARKGELRVIADLDYGSVARYIQPNQWPMHVNISTGWVCLGNLGSAGEAVEFLRGCVAVVAKEQLIALWLKPEQLPIF